MDDIEFDEFCDPANPKKTKYDDILTAARRISGAVVKTPCIKANMADKLGMDLYYKQEFLQRTGSFKERGVRNTLTNLTEEQKKFGVISATSGNHGLALAHHCTQLSIPFLLVMPTNASRFKVDKLTKMGTKIIFFGTCMGEAKKQAMGIAKDKKMYYINGYDHPNVIEGQGTVGIEIVEQVPNVDAVLVPVGGGSLIAGVATAIKFLKPDTEIYGIETEKTASMTEALRKNERVFFDIDTTLADGLNINTVGVNTFHSVKGIVDKMVVVREDWVVRALMHIVEDEKFIVEGSGAVGVAAIMAGLFPNLKGKKVVSILTGGNIETTVMGRVMERGMAAEGRLLKFRVTVPDRPGSMAELAALMASIGVTVRDCVPERAWVKSDVFSVELKMLVETRGWDQTKEVMEQIKKHYKEFFFHDLSDKPPKSEAPRRGPCLAPNPVCMQK